MAKLQSAGSVAGKETIYVDVDDEITSIIDKLRSAKGKVVALVLPKRAPVLQSVVNMKLLKRTAENAGKNLVLVTTEAGLLPLAGSVGLYVADTPSSKPSIPPAPVGPSDEPEDLDEPLDIVDNSADEAEDFNAETASSKSVGELAAAGAASKIAEDDIDESIDMDDPAPAAAAVATPKSKKNKKLAVPNFDSFKKKLALAAGVLVLLVAAAIFAIVVLPKATITIHTDSSTITTNLNLALDTSAKKLDTADGILPATAQSQQKSASQQVAATGQQNNGQKATGSVTMNAGSCSGDVPSSISAGTSLSGSSHTFILNDSVVFSPTVSHGKCTFTGIDSSTNSSSIPITALRGGADYNVSGSFTVSGYPSVTTSGTTSGGTDNITKVVAQSDIDSATTKLKTADNSNIKQQLVSALQAKGLQAVSSTFLAGDPQVTTSSKAGDAADSVTVTAVTQYTMLGVQKSDLKTLVDSKVEGQLDKGKQVILDDGVANATFTQSSPATATNASVAMQTKSLAGPQLDVSSLKQQLAGKKAGDVQNLLKQTPGVTSVSVKYSPFWVSTVPKKAAKVTLLIDKSGAQ